MTDKTVLIAGASGLVGGHALRHFVAAGGATVAAISRRPPELPKPGRYRHLALDLTDPGAVAEAVKSLGPVSHVVYAAVHEKADVVAGWRDPEQMATNAAMLKNLIEPVIQAGGLRHVVVLQGTKAYGAHIHRIAVPARERAPRDAHDNFYWLQEDYLRARAAQAGFAFTIFRPQMVFGDAIGGALNMIPVIGAFAAICRESGRPFGFPGGLPYVCEAIDARLMARAFAWAGESPAAAGRTFNITNGDVFVWQNVWPAIADALGLKPAPDAPLKLADFLPTQAAIWDKIVAKHGLQKLSLARLIGTSAGFTDWSFAHGLAKQPPPILVSTIALRQAGFGDCIDTEDMLRDHFKAMIGRKLLPGG
ncbi:MAG: SDR family oxidoreductase [Alphaproteobacteria bacterium]|nr:SDR family oxidoreductase [Alphaproteobacteria bacterium]